ncbi:MAG TPA: diguanylate cyclase [Burkholderiaceae bacterium]|jgi:diguanylate cyclase (GGDEF)-like protein
MTPPPVADNVPPSQQSGWRHGLDAWLFTEDRIQRLRLRQTGLAIILMTLCALLMQYVVWLGDAPAFAVKVWTLCSVGGLVLSYVLIRCGWSLRLADPSMTVVQMLFALTTSVAGYMLLGPMRGAVFPVAVLILMFGMFRLRPRASLWVALYALTLFGLGMAVMANENPQTYTPAIELGHFLVLCVALPGVAELAGRVSRIRMRQQEQKLELSRALEQIRAMATHDELTGLLNRRHMQTILEQEAARCLRGGHGYCLALIDLDHFKQINDRFGHAAGDCALREFARVGLGVIRGADVLARWGGEEFVLMLAETRMPAALAGVERLREAVFALDAQHAGQQLKITFSAGLTESRPRETLGQTLERADKLLYRAKADGRNRVTIEY